MLKNFLRYVINLPRVWKKLSVLHGYSVFLDESTSEELEKSLRAWRTIKRDYGYLRSLKEQQCVDEEGAPIPWYTYPAIDQLSRWDFSQCEVLEYGCGNSTRWWSGRAKAVTSIENSRGWYEQVLPGVPDNCKMILAEVDGDDDPQGAAIQAYVDVIDDLGQFDVIIVDGVNIFGARQRCAQKALSHLKEGGLLIVDNTDWLPHTCRTLREQGFYGLDYVGLGPLNVYPETTSLFFRQGFQIIPRHEAHPGFSKGGIQRELDSP